MILSYSQHAFIPTNQIFKIRKMQNPAATQYQTTIGSKSLKIKVENDNLLVLIQEIQGAFSATGVFSSDTIRELSAGLIDTPEEMLRLIESCSNELISLTEDGNLLVKFKYDIQGKIKTKDIRLVLTQVEVEAVQALRIQNEKLRIKTSRLQAQVCELKRKCQTFERQINDLRQLKEGYRDLRGQFTSLSGTCSYLTSQLGVIQAKWPLVDSFFQGNDTFRLSSHWQLHAFANNVDFFWQKSGYNQRLVIQATNQKLCKWFVFQ